MKRFFFASIAALGLLGATATEAHANGRFPESNQLVFSKDDPDLVLLRVTFGLLVSHDRGKTFDWVCEQSIGYSGFEDPMYTSTLSGRILGTTFQGLATTANQGCDWALATGDLSNRVFIDLTTNVNDHKNVIVFSSSYKGPAEAGTIIFSSKLWETKDEGNSFTPLGDELDPRLLGYTVDMTATDPNRLYISAVRNPGPTGVGILLTSKDHGKTWTEQEIPLVGSERSLFIAAVDPVDAEKVYLRTMGIAEEPARLILREKNPAGDDGVFRTLFTSAAPLEGFALSPDNKKVWVGSPLDGVQLASTSDYKFTQQSATEVKCLVYNDSALWACSNEKVGFIAGVSKDDGKTFEPILHFCTIRGPLACSASSTTAQQCAPLWASQRSTGLGCEDGPNGSDGGNGLGGEAGAGDGSVPTGGPFATPKSSCNCEAVLPSGGWSTAFGAAASMGAAAIAIARRRSRRRKP